MPTICNCPECNAKLEAQTRIEVKHDAKGQLETHESIIIKPARQ